MVGSPYPVHEARERPNVLARVASALAFGATSGLVAAAFEARWVAAHSADYGAVYQSVVGTWLPLGLLVGCVVAALSLLLHGPLSPWQALKAYVLGLEPAARARVARGVVWALLMLLVWMVIVANAAMRTLALELNAPTVGMVLAGVSLLYFVAAVGIGQGFARGSAARGINPTRFYETVLIALLIFAFAFGVLVVVGSTGGQGPSYRILGVLRRQELDLRAVSLLALLASASYLGSLRLSARPALALSVAVVSLCASAFWWSGSRGFADPVTTLAVERYAPLTRVVLAPLRKAIDRDGDGFSAWFGGGDCNDGDPRIRPGADDAAGNKIDEDCSGLDSVVLPDSEPAPKEGASSSALVHDLPKDLNLLLITVDTLRADLGFLGYPRNVSPNLDKLAARSIVYENAYALASYTSKSLAPMLVGKYASETDLGFRHFNRFGPQDVFLPERLQGAFHTISVQGYWYFYEPSYGFERGFNHIDSRAAPQKRIIEGDQTSNGDELTDNALELLKDPNHTGKRFYMWVHYVDPHAEYVPHTEFDFGSKGRDRYDGEVAFVDHHLGRIFDYLEQSGLMNRTIIAFTSDHGEAFGEHGFYRHGFELWEALMRVPLLFYVPGLEPRRISERRSIIDVAPTLLELLSVSLPNGEGQNFFSGQSLVPEFLGANPEPRRVFMDMSAGPYNDERQSLIQENLKIITSGGRVMGLYDLGKDPKEEQDLSSNAKLRELALARLSAFKKELKVVPMKRDRKD